MITFLKNLVEKYLTNTQRQDQQRGRNKINKTKERKSDMK